MRALSMPAPSSRTLAIDSRHAAASTSDSVLRIPDHRDRRLGRDVGHPRPRERMVVELAEPLAQLALERRAALRAQPRPRGAAAELLVEVRLAEIDDLALVHPPARSGVELDRDPTPLDREHGSARRGHTEKLVPHAQLDLALAGVAGR